MSIRSPKLVLRDSFEMNKPQIYGCHVLTTLVVLIGDQGEMKLSYMSIPLIHPILKARSSMHPRVYFIQCM